MIRSHLLAAAAGLGVLIIVSPLAAEGLPTEVHKLLPAALAIEVAQTAIATCKGQADRSGLPQLLIVGDGASALSREVARRKAYIAAAQGLDGGFRQESGERGLQCHRIRPPTRDGRRRSADQGRRRHHRCNRGERRSGRRQG